MTATSPPMHPTLVSDLIRDLQGVLDVYGDMPVCAVADEWVTARVLVDVRERYYDGGYLIPSGPYSPRASRHWVRSRNQETYPLLCRILAVEPEPASSGDPVEHRDTIDGVPMPDDWDESP